MADESGSNPNPAKERLSSSPSPEKRSPSARPRFNLLLAEDNLPDVLLVREAIHAENLPIEIYTARDGEEAIRFVARAEADPNAPCPDGLLLDLNLPKMNGFEVLRTLRASGRYGAIPVLIVTSSDSPSDQKEAAQLGARYFRKPPSYEEYLKLGAVLKQMLKDNGFPG